jgi:3-hydroxyacyl-CoA dehydrogenase/3-hydroxy-2-methylbutyryl-CoA dehydrogenase
LIDNFDSISLEEYRSLPPAGSRLFDFFQSNFGRTVTHHQAMLSNVVAIVSGGSSGLGGATVKQVFRHGGKCIVADLPSSIDRFNRLLVEIEEEAASANKGGVIDHKYNTNENAIKDAVVFAATDVTQPDQISAALDLAERHFVEPVNVAVSCAGVAPAKRTLSVQKDKDGNDRTTIRVHPMDVFSQTLNVNVTGTFNLARLSAERMLSRPLPPDIGDDTNNSKSMRGCIINTASISAYEGQIGQVAYSASKGAVVGMTLPLARDLAEHRIRVMTIAPGLFLTPLLEGLPPAVKDGTSPYIDYDEGLPNIHR